MAFFFFKDISYKSILAISIFGFTEALVVIRRILVYQKNV